MAQHLRLLYRYRELLLVWTLRELKVRYKQSLLGGAWAIAQPLSLMLIFSLIFTYFIKMPTEGIPYPLFCYSALLPWTLVATSISFSATSLTQNMNLVTRIYFPREILPASAVAAALVDFLVAAIVFAAMMVYYQVPLGASALLIPVLLITQVLLILGIVLFASAANVFYRDIRFVVPLGLQLWMYATPVIYPASLVPERLRSVYMLNPMAALIESYRAVVLRGTWPDWSHLALAAGTSCAICVLGYAFFKRLEDRFADII